MEKLEASTNMETGWMVRQGWVGPCDAGLLVEDRRALLSLGDVAGVSD